MKTNQVAYTYLNEKPDISIGALVKAVHSNNPVIGYTHNFYRHPGRFSPEFCRAAIETFTKPGETVLDPFMGGGTAAVETLTSGRRFIGCDLNPLAVYLARVKTTPLTRSDIQTIESWAMSLQKHINLRGKRDAPK